mgnify:CR=1 FL=1
MLPFLTQIWHRHPEDHEAFQRTLPQADFLNHNHGLPSPPSPTPSIQHQPEAQAFTRLISSSTLPSQLNMTCRKIYNVLTGPKAARRAAENNLIDALGMREIWNDLDRCWHDFHLIRRNTVNNDDPASRADTEQYACAWQIFIFECRECQSACSFMVVS